MIGLALRSLRFHKGGFIASFIALFFGAAIVIACGGLLETGVRAVAEPQRLAAAPVVVTGDQSYPGQNKVFRERVRLDASDVKRIASAEGVAEAVPETSFPAALVGRGGEGVGRATGHNWSSARLGPYRIDEGSAPARSGQVALDARLAEKAGVSVGQRLALDVRGGTRTYTVTSLVEGPGSPGTLFLSDADAAKSASQRGKVDSVGVLPADGASAAAVRDGVEKALKGTDAAVLTGDERGRAEFPDVVTDAKTLVSMSAVFGGLAVMVTVFVVAGTLGLSIQQRQREMALLRAIGSTPSQVRRMILGETLVVAVFATALACFPAPRLGAWLLDAFVEGGVVPEVMIHRAGWVPMAAGAGAALVTALGAAFLAARGASRTRPTEALAESALQRRWFNWSRLVVAVLCLAGAAVLSWVTSTMDGPKASGTATPAAMLWAAGFGLLGPGLTRLVTALLRWPLRAVSGFAGHLAMLNAKARSIRLAGAVMPVMLATGLATALIYLQTTQSSGAEEAFKDNLRADLVVTSATGGLPLSEVDAVAGQPGVAAASAYVPSSGFLEPSKAEWADYDGKGKPPKGEPVQIEGVSSRGVEKTTSVRVSSGDLGALRGDTVALPESLAEERGARIGERVPMRLGDGTRTRPELVATIGERRGYEGALLPASTVAGHTTDGMVKQILVRAAPGTDTAELARTLAASDPDRPGLRAADRGTLTAAQAEQDETQTWVAYLLVAMVVGYAVIALVNTLVMATGERRREFTLQRLVGATRGQVMRMMTVEALLTALAGIVLGTVVAAATLVPLSKAVLDSSMPVGPPWIFVTVTISALALTLFATLFPARFALRTRPSAAVGVRE